MKNKLKIIATLTSLALLVCAGSSLYYSYSYFTDKQEGYQLEYLVAEPEYRCSFSTAAPVPVVSPGSVVSPLLKIKNTSPFDMDFLVEVVNSQNEKIMSKTYNVKAGLETSVNVDLSIQSSTSEGRNLIATAKIKPVAMTVENGEVIDQSYLEIFSESLAFYADVRN